MIYITGDTHGDFSRIERFCDMVKPDSSDTMIILGDAGLNYYSGERDRNTKLVMSRLPITIFSIHGNHEARPETIPSYHAIDWRGGKVYIEDDYPNLLFAMDGEVYDHIIPKYCEGMFPSSYGRVIDFMHVDDEDMEVLRDAIEWLPVTEAKLLHKPLTLDNGSHNKV